MNIKSKLLNIYNMTWATSTSSNYCNEAIKRAERIQSDSDKKVRLEKQQCKACHYIISRIGGAAITHTNCSSCGKDIHFGNTCVDVLCLECAKEHKLCVHCGGDIDMKVGRRKWPEFQKSTLQLQDVK